MGGTRQGFDAGAFRLLMPFPPAETVDAAMLSFRENTGSGD
jgi:hypothetical protein